MTSKNSQMSMDNGVKYYCIITDANTNKETSNKTTVTVTSN